jgi:uncharacterized protein (DUF1778 family)
MPTSVLSVRVSDTERSLLENAARHAHTNLSDFIRKKALESAEMEILERTTVEIPAEKWQEFEAWMDQPPKVIPALKALMSMKPRWE